MQTMLGGSCASLALEGHPHCSMVPLLSVLHCQASILWLWYKHSPQEQCWQSFVLNRTSENITPNSNTSPSAFPKSIPCKGKG